MIDLNKSLKMRSRFVDGFLELVGHSVGLVGVDSHGGQVLVEGMLLLEGGDCSAHGGVLELRGGTLDGGVDLLGGLDDVLIKLVIEVAILAEGGDLLGGVMDRELNGGDGEMLAEGPSSHHTFNDSGDHMVFRSQLVRKSGLLEFFEGVVGHVGVRSGKNVVHRSIFKEVECSLMDVRRGFEGVGGQSPEVRSGVGIHGHMATY